ncbi:MAG: biotin transporter BioY [Anaerolineae bacterium]|nr:biotin transporter BioY [Anaerolineae bacterium]MDW8297888.1 biotin transporter BioY [Anaerolineae bacterium]
MRTHAQVQPLKAILTLFLRISIAVLLLSLSAKVTVTLPNTPVPITFQVLAVLLLGLTLGSREAAASVGAYLVAIASGLPLDARGLGTAAFAGPTAGYLIAFLPAAALAGIGRGRGTWSAFAICCVSVLVIYIGGALVMLGFVGSWERAIALGVAPFILADFGKALLAVSLIRLGRALRISWIM